MFSKLIEKIRKLFSPKQATVGSIVPEKKPTVVTLGNGTKPLPARYSRPTPPPPPPPARTLPRRVDTSVRQSAVSSGSSHQQSPGIDPLTAGMVGYMIGSSGNNTAPATKPEPEREYVYMGDGMMEEVITKPTPVVCEPTPVFDSPAPSVYEPSHTPSYESSYSSSDSYSSSSSDYSSSSYDSGSYDSGSSSSFD